MVSLKNQSATITARQGKSLDLHKLIEAVKDSELGVKDIEITIQGKLIVQDGRLAVKEGVKGALFLITEGLKADEKLIGKEIRLRGQVHALNMRETPPHLMVESFEPVKH